MKAIKQILSIGLLIFSVVFFANPAFALVKDSPDQTTIVGKDIVGVSLPLYVQNIAQAPENTWGRILRLNAPQFNQVFFDLGIDEKGNFFINSPKDTKTSHSLVITPDGHVTFSK